MEVLNKLDINSFRFEDCQVDSNIMMPKSFKVQRDELDIDQFVMYVLSEYNNIREGNSHLKPYTCVLSVY